MSLRMTRPKARPVATERTWEKGDARKGDGNSLQNSQVENEVIFCHYCGYGVDAIPSDGCCPKCDHYGWERNVIRKRLVPAVDNL